SVNGLSRRRRVAAVGGVKDVDDAGFADGDSRATGGETPKLSVSRVDAKRSRKGPSAVRRAGEVEIVVSLVRVPARLRAGASRRSSLRVFGFTLVNPDHVNASIGADGDVWAGGDAVGGADLYDCGRSLRYVAGVGRRRRFDCPGHP